MDSAKTLSRILNVEPSILIDLNREMTSATGRSGILDGVVEKNQLLVNYALQKIDGGEIDAYHVIGGLRKAIFSHEEKFKRFLEEISGVDIFEKAAILSKKVARVDKGFFLKKNNIEKILLERQPYRLLEYLGYNDVNTLIEKEDLEECFSALRFVESKQWMHETFDALYSNFTADDFEEREIEIKVLGPKWRKIAEQFVAKKHHNVSHLKEFGIIFLNPISENIPGKLLRDFNLLLHYFHEIKFYSDLFKKYSVGENFVECFKSLLRGDVREITAIGKGEWLIVQRYLVKENLSDVRLFLPRVNPESLHWSRGERDLGEYFKDTVCSDLSMWSDFNWIGNFFTLKDKEEFLSFDIEDNAMSLVAFMEGKEQFFTYHQREAMWTKIFSEYVGGEEKMEKLLIENFDKGIIKFK